jgi:outer membrane protein TolC
VTDLDVGVSYNNLGENNNAWDGISDSFTGKWAGPSGRLGLAVDVPFKNNLQKGLLKQQRASLSSTQISAADLERTIALGIARDTGSIEQIVRQTVNFGRAAAAYREAVEIEMERLQYGSVTVLDTLVTQQRSLFAELSLIDSEARFARILAQLAFDTGTLVVQQDGHGSVDPMAFTNLPVQ